MGLSLHFRFHAPAKTSGAELERFLKLVENEAIQLGFKPTMVLNAQFNTEERRAFARHLTSGLPIENERLKGLVLIKEGQVFSHDPVNGHCRLIPEQGIILAVTDESKKEAVFGFFRYPKELKDFNDKKIIDTGIGGEWGFRDFLNSPDPRYRTILKKFAEAGYLIESKDEFSR